MIQPTTLGFLRELSQNNNKAWFDKNREGYMAAKEDFEAVISDLLIELSMLEPAFREQKAKDIVFRIFRDVRFSKDKTPYKAHFGAYFSKGGRKYEGAGYYLHVEPGKSFIGGGLWMPEGSLLKKVRQEIDYNLQDFERILTGKEFKKVFSKLEGEQLKTLPQGYEADNPAIGYLKHKSFTVGKTLSDKDLVSKNFKVKVREIFTTLKPLIDFLNRPLE